MSDKIEIIAELKDLVSGKMTEINASVAKLEASLNKVDNVGKSGSSGMLKSIIGGNLITQGIGAATGAIKNFVTEGINGFIKFEQFGVALTTMFHGNKIEAKQLSNELVQFAKTTPYELTEVQNATKQLIAFGSTSQGVGKELRMLGDVGSGIGSSLGDLSYLYGTVRTQGRAMTMDINQFANRGIPIWKELEKITGKSGLALRKFVEEGKVGFPIIEKAFKNMTSEGGQFTGMMTEQSKTLGGQISNLSDAYSQFQIHTMESKGGLLKDLTSWATEFISTLDKGVVLANRAGDAIKQADKNRGISNRGGGLHQISSQDKEANNIYATGANRFHTSASPFGNGFNENKDYQGFLDQQTHFSDRNSNNIVGSVKFINKEITDMMRLQRNAPAQDFNRIQDYLDMAKSEQREMIDWLTEEKRKDKLKPDKPGADKGILDDSKNLDVLAKANRPTQMYITIKEQIHEVNITAATLKEGVNDVVSMLSKGLMMAVNDLSVLTDQR